MITGERDISAEVIESNGTEQDEDAAFDVTPLLTGQVKAAYLNVPTHLKELDEAELYAAVDPSATDWSIRRNFTAKVREARKLHLEEITATSIYEDVITRSYFYTFILPNPLKVAFITRPLLDHSRMYEAIHEECMAKIFAIVKTHPIDPKYVPQLAKLAEMSANRAHGAVVQRQQIVQKNINGGTEGAQKQIAAGSIQEQIDALQKQLLTATRDVSPQKDPE